MKKLKIFAIILGLSFLISGCSKAVTSIDDSKPSDYIPTTAETKSSEPKTSEIITTAAENQNEASSETEYDVDLTKLSSTMIYGEVYNMMVDPEAYVGKTIKMQGKYVTGFYDATGQYYHYVVIEDATACCQQGLEFLWSDHTYPEDFPTENSEIIVTGVYKSYTELEIVYYYVDVEDIQVL